jgi:ribonuclease HI
MTLYTDGAFNKHTGQYAWGFVVNEDGKCALTDLETDLLDDLVLEEKKTPKGIRQTIMVQFPGVKQQNTGAELISTIAALRLAVAGVIPDIKFVYNDSTTVVNHWSTGKAASKMPDIKLKYIAELGSLCKKFKKMGGELLFVSGDDNLADPGMSSHHKKR